jgi:hypothetical protein
MVLGVMGNLATCLVILNNEYMRTPTNVYLLNLAIADIATLVISKIILLLLFQSGFTSFSFHTKVAGHPKMELNSNQYSYHEYDVAFHFLRLQYLVLS